MCEELLEKGFKLDIVNILKSGPVTKNKVKEMLDIDSLGPIANTIFNNNFKEFVKEKVISTHGKSKYKLNIEEDFFVGKLFFMFNGNAFLKSGENEYYVNKRNVANAMHEDVVIATLAKRQTGGKKLDAEVITVVEHTLSKVVGTYMEMENNFGFVLPDKTNINRDIFISNKLKGTAQSYDKVVCKIVKFPRGNTRNPEGEILEVIGVKGEKGVDSQSIIKENDIREDFPPEVKRDASEIITKISEEEIKKRLDLREECIYTIDGVEAKDLDDAICVKKTDTGYKLGVHIADVTYYVKENGNIDKEALLRGTSVYLIDKVIPMLPKVLSNGVCSLNPAEDKLTLSCLVDLDFDGNVKFTDVRESVVSSKARLNYDECTDYLLTGNPEFIEKHGQEVADNLKLAEELSHVLEKKRLRRGSIEFDFPESKIILDEDGHPVEIKPYERGVSNNVIEECMLCANEAIAELFHKLEIPFVYRIHDYPRVEKLERLKSVSSIYGIDFKFEKLEEISPKDVQNLLSKYEKEENNEPIKLMLLQSMQQARYSNECSAHFGLAADYYCHFTSPIRRYPDLQIHRIIKEYLHGNINNVTKEKYLKITEEVSKHCSKTERTADAAEKELDKLKMIEYMDSNIGEVFEGYVRSFNKSGMFIVLDNTIDGYVKQRDFEYDEDNYMGFLNGKEIRLGTRVKVKALSSNTEKKEISLKIVQILD